MTEVALRPTTNATVVPYEPATAAIASLADWAAELDAAYTMAKKLCTTSFAPKHFRDKPEEAAAAILTGHEMGLSPMASLRSIFNIGGTPGMYAKVMVAIAQSHGHIVHVAEQSDERVVVRGRRKGESDWVETVWDRARVVKAKLTSNPKYQESAQQMMVARGQAEIARQVAADALHGIPYSVEELEDMPPVRVEATVAPRVTAAEILGGQGDSPLPEEDQWETSQTPAEPTASPATPVEPTSTSPTPADVETQRPNGTITAAQRRMLHALLRNTDRSDREVALVFIAGVLEREVESTKELSKADAGKVIDALTAETADAQPAIDVDIEP